MLLQSRSRKNVISDLNILRYYALNSEFSLVALPCCGKAIRSKVSSVVNNTSGLVSAVSRNSDTVVFNNILLDESLSGVLTL